MAKLISDGTIELDRGVSVYSCAAAVGKMESDGPLGNCFDYAAEGAELGLTTWEKAESTFQQYAFDIALRKGKLIKEDISFIFAGDLLNQCTGSAYGLRDTDISFIGLYGACSTMAESLAMASLFASPLVRVKSRDYSLPGNIKVYETVYSFTLHDESAMQ